ncbi:hypothetical protein [Cystobacter fuscus]|uniref:hypothetical protein n=1 Tax=Cystobacter fuscus TaxID=43 RepID=UPI002B2F1FB6|nr:hypothetical protein F0U63_02050 [Cystobacter fuscus]
MSKSGTSHGSRGTKADEDSVFVKERQFRDDPEAWARRADEAPRVVVTSDDGERVSFVIIQQREPLD